MRLALLSLLAGLAMVGSSPTGTREEKRDVDFLAFFEIIGTAVVECTGQCADLLGDSTICVAAALLPFVDGGDCFCGQNLQKSFIACAQCSVSLQKDRAAMLENIDSIQSGYKDLCGLLSFDLGLGDLLFGADSTTSVAAVQQTTELVQVTQVVTVAAAETTQVATSTHIYTPENHSGGRGWRPPSSSSTITPTPTFRSASIVSASTAATTGAIMSDWSYWVSLASQASAQGLVATTTIVVDAPAETASPTPTGGAAAKGVRSVSWVGAGMAVAAAVML